MIVVIVTNPDASSASGATWGGNAFTIITADVGNFYVSALYLPNAPVGTHAIDVSFPIFSHVVMGTAFVISGAKTIGAVSTLDNNTSGSGSTSLTTLVNDSLIMNYLMGSNTTYTAGVGQTEVSNRVDAVYRQEISTQPVTVAGTLTTSSVSFSGATTYTMQSFEITSESIIPPTTFMPQVLMF
jgi:hypothetical protein